jgi:hypothetical protein
MKIFAKQCFRAITVAFLLLAPAQVIATDRPHLEQKFEQEFQKPPDEAHPWVYWFWLNGNITKEGITADLEAMKRVGIRGVLIMEVDQGSPAGPANFMGAQWRELFKHVHKEAKRLDLEVNMNNDAGWNGSGGPWIKPEDAMQQIVWNETELTGPRHFDATLAVPESKANFYRDICLLAFHKMGSYRIPNIRSKAAFEFGPLNPTEPTNLPPEMVLDRKLIQVITRKMDENGRLVWDVPEGDWTVVRFGHTTTGVENAPAPKTGRGLECDKLSKRGIDANFDGMMEHLIADNRIKPGKQKFGLVATHIDSWENGSQNWTPLMRQEFWERRGYDMELFLPVVTGRVVDSLEVSERFLWDLRKTVSELVIVNYSGHMKDLAHNSGLRYTVEAYGSPCDFLTYAGQADEPMGEFWTPSGSAMETCKGMASAAHIYGKRIVGAEAFTADDHERWLEHPALLKSLGDRAFCEGINRFVFHRYAMQPWVPERRPGMMMGPWGQHYERTQTWWEQSSAWHEYLARCQFLLRQGVFVADICYLQAETPPQGFGSHPRNGYDWDECTADAVMGRMKVQQNQIILPDGMTYRLLVLPSTKSMTPALLQAIRELAQAGATIIGAPPEKSPSLNRYPKAEAEMKDIVADLWADCDGVNMKSRKYGKGLVVRGIDPEQYLREAGLQPDFIGHRQLRYIHRSSELAEIYFVASSAKNELITTATFRVGGRIPELWWPETGRIELAPVFHQTNDTTTVALQFPSSGSVFVIFRAPLASQDSIVSLSREGKPVLDAVNLQIKGKPVQVTVQRARYGVLTDPARTRDVREKLQKLLDSGLSSFKVARMAEGDDPAFLVVKTLEVDYTVDGKIFHLTGTDPEDIDFEPEMEGQDRIASIHPSTKSGPLLEAWSQGEYEALTASGRVLKYSIPSVLSPLEVTGPWQLQLGDNAGKASAISLNQLVSWSEHADARLKYFSGTATYSKRFDIPGSMIAKDKRIYLDLGDVQVMAEVTLNGQKFPLIWKSPFVLDITGVAKRGSNRLEVKVVNLWPNRLIGDEQLPEDSERNQDGTLKRWPEWLTEGKPSPAGRSTFVSWRLWKKQDALIRSGLLGPVRLRCSQIGELK